MSRCSIVAALRLLVLVGVSAGLAACRSPEEPVRAAPSASVVAAPALPQPEPPPPPGGPATPTAQSYGTSNEHHRQPQLRLGHYSSGDGLIGFVLDRTTATARLKMDGQSASVTLEARNEDERGVDYVAKLDPKRSIFLRATVDGALTLVEGRSSVAMFRDADAASLTAGVGSGNASPPSQTPEDKHNLLPRLRLGHYSSGDGAVGMVLDRTGPQPRMRLDGTREVVTLTPEGESGDSVDLSVVGRGNVMRVGPHGEVSYFKGRITYAMKRDGDADPLP